MKIDLNDVKISKHYLALVPRMNKEDDAAFDDSVRTDGIRDPLTFNQDGLLLDGHSRYAKAVKYYKEFSKRILDLVKLIENQNKVIKENQIEKKAPLLNNELTELKRELSHLTEHIKLFVKVPYRVKHFDDKLLEEQYVIECNLQRRHLTNYQKIELGIPLLEIQMKLAKQRQLATLKQNKGKPLESNDPNDTKGKSIEIVARKIGVSSTTMMRGKTIYEKAPLHLKTKLREGKVSINVIYQHVTRPERNLPKAIMPKEICDVFVCDVPIEFDNKSIRGAAMNHYPTMSAEELAKLKIPSADNAIMFFWISTAKQYEIVNGMPLYKYILDAWGFTVVKSEFVWNKESIGNGSWVQNQHEKCLIAVKGKMPIPAVMFPSLFSEPRTRHSAKPLSFLGKVEKMYPKRNYMELFSREQYNDNWAVFGNEVKQ